LFPALIFTQPRNKRNQEFILAANPFGITILTDSAQNYNLYFTYRVPYEKIVFQKGENNFESVLQTNIEIYDSTKNLVTREFDQKEVTTPDFEETNSKNQFVQGFIKVNLKKGNYFIETSFSDLNSGNDMPFKMVPVSEKDFEQKNVVKPVIVNSQMLSCGDYDYFQLANRNNHIPFSNELYDMIIPVTDTSVQYLDITLQNQDDTILTKRIYKLESGNLQLENCSNNIILYETGSYKVNNYFKLDSVNKNVFEGPLIINIMKENDSDNIAFEIPVVWDDKPISLRNPEFAIEMLKFIESESKIDELLSVDEKNYPEELFNYWKKSDPSPGTSFNELMDEYYGRVDFAAKEFRGLGMKSGVDSDRSKVYIRYGKPDSVERNSNNNGNMIEKWSYKNPERTFVFVDKRGTGNFTLVE